jgi:hypothetical protein
MNLQTSGRQDERQDGRASPSSPLCR